MFCNFRQPSHVIYLQVKAEKLAADTWYQILPFQAFQVVHNSLDLSQFFPHHILIKKPSYKVFRFLNQFNMFQDLAWDSNRT